MVLNVLLCSVVVGGEPEIGNQTGTSLSSSKCKLAN